MLGIVFSVKVVGGVLIFHTLMMFFLGGLGESGGSLFVLSLIERVKSYHL